MVYLQSQREMARKWVWSEQGGRVQELNPGSEDESGKLLYFYSRSQWPHHRRSLFLLRSQSPQWYLRGGGRWGCQQSLRMGPSRSLPLLRLGALKHKEDVALQNLLVRIGQERSLKWNTGGSLPSARFCLCPRFRAIFLSRSRFPLPRGQGNSLGTLDNHVGDLVTADHTHEKFRFISAPGSEAFSGR